VTVAVGCVGGLVLGALALSPLDFHARLAAAGLATLALIAAVVAGIMLPVQRLWTNEWWGLPTAKSMTIDQARTLARMLGRVYLIFGVAGSIAMIGGLIGMVPKLVYVGEAPIPAMFLGIDVALLLVAGVVALRAWKLFRSVRISPTRRIR
jgi:hypothetical protein